MNTTVFQGHGVPVLLLSHESRTAPEHNKRSNSSIRKQRAKSSLLTPDFHSLRRKGSLPAWFHIPRFDSYSYCKPGLLQYCSFGRMCCVCEINVEMWKTVHNTPPLLSPSQTLRLLWISCLAEVNEDMRGGMPVRDGSL